MIITKQDCPATPMLDKMKAVRPETEAAGAFLEWLLTEAGYVLAEYVQDGPSLPYPAHFSIEQLLARWKEIDLNAVEAERRAILDMIRAANDAHPPAHSDTPNGE